MVELFDVIERLLGVGYRLDHMPTFHQAAVQVMTQECLILDHQQFHTLLPIRPDTPAQE
ncbi:hypothetical protein D3C80_1617600 [compost metagenome]